MRVSKAIDHSMIRMLTSMIRMLTFMLSNRFPNWTSMVLNLLSMSANHSLIYANFYSFSEALEPLESCLAIELKGDLTLIPIDEATKDSS